MDTAPVLNETVTYAPDGAGHWNGPAYLTHHTYGDQAHRSRRDADEWNAAQRRVRPAPDVVELAGRVVELAARIACDRIDRRAGRGPDPEALAMHAVTLNPAALARLANRLRATLDAGTGVGPCGPIPVPPVPLAEVWDAPVSVWQHPTDGPTHVAAMAVQPATFLETWQHRHGYEVARDRYGAEVIARSSAAGRADVHAVAWLPDPVSPHDTAAWRWVTGELSAAEMTAWHGLPVRINERRGVDDRTAAWLHSLINN